MSWRIATSCALRCDERLELRFWLTAKQDSFRQHPPANYNPLITAIQHKHFVRLTWHKEFFAEHVYGLCRDHPTLLVFDTPSHHAQGVGPVYGAEQVDQIFRLEH
jgi:hypothetical protein